MSDKLLSQLILLKCRPSKVQVEKVLREYKPRPGLNLAIPQKRFRPEISSVKFGEDILNHSRTIAAVNFQYGGSDLDRSKVNS